MRIVISKNDSTQIVNTDTLYGGYHALRLGQIRVMKVVKVLRKKCFLPLRNKSVAMNYFYHI